MALFDHGDEKLSLQLHADFAVKDLTWWKVGGAADWFCEPESLSELIEAAQFAVSKKIPIEIIGGGSNVLVSDAGIEGLLISTRRLSELSIEAESPRLSLVALCGTPKARLLKIFLERRLSPSIFLTGLPGDVGGGVVMNAGVGSQIRPREFGELVDWVEVLRFDQNAKSPDDFQLIRIEKERLHFDYRESSGWQPGIIYRVGLSWPSEPDPEIKKQVQQANKNRVMTQPLHLPSGGSVFRNPLPLKAGRLIEEAGLKGHQIGGAQISEKHANFIVNLGSAKAQDIQSLIHTVQQKVWDTQGIRLETEVRWIGRK